MSLLGALGLGALGLAAVGLTACGAATKPASPSSTATPEWQRTRQALLEPASPLEDASGSVRLVEDARGVTITLLVAGASAGDGLVTLGDAGACDGEGATDTATLGRVKIGKNGTGELEITVPGATLGTGATSLVGRSIVLNATAAGGPVAVACAEIH